MFGHAVDASNAYRRLAVETAALGADRHQLIALLFSNTLGAIAQARAALARGDVETKVAATTRALRLVDEGLKSAVDRSVEGLGESLYGLYDYCTRRLLQAQLRNDGAIYEEVAALIGQLQAAWAGIAPAPVPSQRRAA